MTRQRIADLLDLGKRLGFVGTYQIHWQELVQLLNDVAHHEREVDFLARELDRCRVPCPNHPLVRCLPFEGCATCANST